MQIVYAPSLLRSTRLQEQELLLEMILYATLVLATWYIRSEKSTLRAIYWSHTICGREAAEVESESKHVFHTLIPFLFLIMNLGVILAFGEDCLLDGC